ncbi:uncharacterized protein PAC_14805 [Phialocephala subalpina]|uniref:Uncharacterized protein n=1 Tax=Phialocephala subalpina TaxID=576137 RepID=A0A1L7XIN8_9HELO|nr:uncharacterized protein PAC_14805 [Phialocephala subalpina]
MTKFRPKIVRRTQEELRARAAQVKSVKPSAKFNAPPTKSNSEIVLRYWDEYKTAIGEPHLQPDFDNLRAFFENLVAERPGLLGERLSEQSLEVYVWRLKTGLQNRHGVELPTAMCHQLVNYIKIELKSMYNLSNKSRPKPLTSCEDVEEQIHFLWAEDDRWFYYERTRVQIAFYLLLLTFTAARPGCVVVSDGYRNSNEALTYKVCSPTFLVPKPDRSQDLQFFLEKDPDGGPPTKILMVDFKLMKGMRYDDSENGHVVLKLREDTTNPHLCPVALAFGMALLDDAFCDMGAAIRYCDEPIRSELLELKLKDSIKGIPVLRTAGHVDRQTKAWTYSGCHEQVISLQFRMGYEIPATEYAIRRNCVNFICVAAAPAQAGKILGQRAPNVLQKYYASTISGIDVQSLAKRQPMHTSEIGKLQRLRVSNNLRRGAPKRLPPNLHHAVVQTKEINELVQQRRMAATPDAHKAAKNNLDVARQRLRKIALKNLRTQYFQTEGSLVVDEPDEPDELQKTNEELGPCRARVVDLMYKSPAMPPHTRHSMLISAIRTMCTSQVSRQPKSNPGRSATKFSKKVRGLSKSGWESDTTLEYDTEDYTPPEDRTCRKCGIGACGLHSGLGRVNGELSVLTKSPTKYQTIFDLKETETFSGSREDEVSPAAGKLPETGTLPETHALLATPPCPYGDCIKHFRPCHSKQFLTDHWQAEHRLRETRRKVCNNQICPAHRGSLETNLMRLLHEDLEFMFKKPKDIQPRIFNEYAIPEVIECL